MRLVRAAACLALLPLACADGPFGPLEERFPALASHPGHRLGDIHPYLLPADAHVTLLTCRWDVDEPIRVSVAADASGAEREAIAAVLAAWEGAGLGVRFEPVEAGPAEIEIQFADGAVETAAGPDSGNTVSECGIPPLGRLAVGARVAGAALVASRIQVARAVGPDLRGVSRPLAPDELRGILLHEMGHALGFHGHARHGETVMVRELERVTAAGRRVGRGEPFSDATLAALYALPNGAVLAREAVARWRTEAVDRMGRRAAAEGSEGPWLRVGETGARVFWRDAGGEQGFVVVNLREALRDPARTLVVAEPRTRRTLSADSEAVR